MAIMGDKNNVMLFVHCCITCVHNGEELRGLGLALTLFWGRGAQKLGHVQILNFGVSPPPPSGHEQLAGWLCCNAWIPTDMMQLTELLQQCYAAPHPSPSSSTNSSPGSLPVPSNEVSKCKMD